MFVKVWCQCVQHGKMEAHFHVVRIWNKGASLIFLGKSHWGYHRKWLHMVLVDGWESTFLLDLSIDSVDTLAMKSLEGVTWHHPNIFRVPNRQPWYTQLVTGYPMLVTVQGTNIYGGFLKWWYSQIIHFNRVLHDFHHPFWGVSPYFWKHPYLLPRHLWRWLPCSPFGGICVTVVPWREKLCLPGSHPLHPASISSCSGAFLWERKVT